MAFPKSRAIWFGFFFWFFPRSSGKSTDHNIQFNWGRLGLVALENFYKKKMLFWEAVQYGSTPANWSDLARIQLNSFFQDLRKVRGAMYMFLLVDSASGEMDSPVSIEILSPHCYRLGVHNSKGRCTVSQTDTWAAEKNSPFLCNPSFE
jgi:hypothetical protein